MHRFASVPIFSKVKIGSHSLKNAKKDEGAKLSPRLFSFLFTTKV